MTRTRAPDIKAVVAVGIMNADNGDAKQAQELEESVFSESVWAWVKA